MSLQDTENLLKVLTNLQKQNKEYVERQIQNLEENNKDGSEYYQYIYFLYAINHEPINKSRIIHS